MAAALTNKRRMGLVLALLVAVFTVASDALFVDVCNVSIGEIRTCEPAVTKGSSEHPTDVCCKFLKKADLPCLCGYKISNLVPSNINIKLAMALPSKCGCKLPAKC
ncbi:hypothetical protein MLD38_040478 [Melastoma candidum]|nr:hypothetical protein MLD38_040907 [Melastoma candidum]KAI4298096.1 hypothetical protein MLD38_040478 [Melastoma candidum]